MSKAILVIDMPDSCGECPCFGAHYSDMNCKASGHKGINYPYPNTFRQDWCPLKELPEYREENTAFGYANILNEGWNNCLDAIFGQDKS